MKMENICRTCLRVSETLIFLYSDLIMKIEGIASIELLSSDDYPKTVCKECVANINTLYNFRRVIINSDKELRERSATLTRLRSTQPCQTEVKSEETETLVIEAEELSDSDPSLPQIQESIKQAIRRQYKCNRCDRSFTSRYKLTQHKRSLHTSFGVCNICGMVVRSDNLKRHISLHLEAPVKCNECGKVFKNSESLRGHMQIHKGTVFTCEVCGRTFKVKAEYKRHYKAHEDPEVGKMMCTICGKKVRDMRKHINSHTGERPYLCAFCMKGFTSPYSLKVHTRQHTNEKPFNCEYCPMAFPQKVSLVNHLKSKHSL